MRAGHWLQIRWNVDVNVLLSPARFCSWKCSGLCLLQSLRLPPGSPEPKQLPFPAPTLLSTTRTSSRTSSGTPRRRRPAGSVKFRQNPSFTDPSAPAVCKVLIVLPSGKRGKKPPAGVVSISDIVSRIAPEVRTLLWTGRYRLLDSG